MIDYYHLSLNEMVLKKTYILFIKECFIVLTFHVSICVVKVRRQRQLVVNIGIACRFVLIEIEGDYGMVTITIVYDKNSENIYCLRLKLSVNQSALKSISVPKIHRKHGSK